MFAWSIFHVVNRTFIAHSIRIHDYIEIYNIYSFWVHSTNFKSQIYGTVGDIFGRHCSSNDTNQGKDQLGLNDPNENHKF
jgi:hypothetical protein